MQGNTDVKDEQEVFDKAANLIREGKNDEAKSILKNSKLHRRSGGSENLTLLHVAADAGNDDMTQHLIDLGSDVGAKTTSGSTPIMLAKKKKHRSIVEILLSKGNTNNSDSETEESRVGTHCINLMKKALEFVDNTSPDYNAHRIKDFTEI